VKSLQLKKYRQEEQCFLVEGNKSVIELFRSDFEIEMIAGTEAGLSLLSKKIGDRKVDFFSVSERELESMGSFQTNESVLAVAKMKSRSIPVPASDKFLLALDDIRDPGNLGTIIRTADWFGINEIIASPQTADFYNPKTISASMGSFCRVGVVYVDLPPFLENCIVPVYGAFLSGQNVHSLKFEKGGIMVIGNESNGISKEVEKLVQHRISIPGSGKTESLNASVATGIILDNIFSSK
jgi:RNA methyltransferase, TrmH family